MYNYSFSGARASDQHRLRLHPYSSDASVAVSRYSAPPLFPGRSPRGLERSKVPGWIGSKGKKQTSQMKNGLFMSMDSVLMSYSDTMQTLFMVASGSYCQGRDSPNS
jgi:hypothetical protein